MVGTFQDVGPLVNDPTLTASAETMILFPHIKQPDFILSLGTGVGQSHVKCNPSFSVTAKQRRNRSVWRVFRMFWKRTSDRSIKQALQSNPRYHRLDIEFEGKEPRLDDVTSIPELKTRIHLEASLQPSIEHVARSAIASLFYLELADNFKAFQIQKKPVLGYIRCSIPAGDPALQKLFEKLANEKAVFYLDDARLLSVSNNDSCLARGFNQGVKLRPLGEFSFSIKQGQCEPCHISGSPFTCERLARAQQLYAPFGRSDHREKVSRKRLVEADGGMGIMRKRRKL
jgi:hypothetical protein